MTDIFDDLGDDPFEASTTPAPKKRGRPAGQTKPKSVAKPVAKPRWRISHYNSDALIAALREVACVIEPGCSGNIAKQLRVAAELLELIENKKA